MNMHAADIQSRLARYLDRRTMPRRIEGKPQAIQDEVRSLSDAVVRSAPRSPERLAGWWPVFEASVGEIVAGGLWPTERDIKDAAIVATKRFLESTPEAKVEPLDEYEIMGRRMARGEPVGEGYLYGRQAVELIRRRLVDEPTMKAYRSGAFLARKAIYKEEAALRWEAEAKERHQAAKDMLREMEIQKRDVTLPNKRPQQEAAE